MERDMGEEKEKSEKRRGFASMSEEERREIAKKGGESVPDEKRSFSQDRDLASDAGRKGGEARGERGSDVRAEWRRGRDEGNS
jgi:general stress protein YciG